MVVVNAGSPAILSLLPQGSRLFPNVNNLLLIRLTGFEFPSPKSDCPPGMHIAAPFLPLSNKFMVFFVTKDIRSGNIAVNHVGCLSHIHNNTLRPALRREGRLTYALFDFDISIMFPSSFTAAECRLPYWMSWHGCLFIPPYDTTQGEIDYDPFAFDVACLGIHFCERHQVCHPSSDSSLLP